jgi:hypothetical protein
MTEKHTLTNRGKQGCDALQVNMDIAILSHRIFAFTSATTSILRLVVDAEAGKTYCHAGLEAGVLAQPLYSFTTFYAAAHGIVAIAKVVGNTNSLVLTHLSRTAPTETGQASSGWMKQTEATCWQHHNLVSSIYEWFAAGPAGCAPRPPTDLCNS